MPAGVYGRKKRDCGIRECIVCHSMFGKRPKTKPYRFRKQKCCSRSCAAKLAVTYCTSKTRTKKQIAITCKFCGQQRFVSPSLANRLFCDVKCMANYYSTLKGDRANHWQGGHIKRTCLSCGGEFECDRNVIERTDRLGGLFCSIACKAKYYSRGTRNPNYHGGKVAKICPECGRVFYVRPSAVEIAVTCSRRCCAIRRMKTQQRQDTNIEKKLERWLNENRVVFEKQKPIAGLTIVDFYIPSMKVLYADGDYWHSLPNVIARDKRINETLKAMGYHVYRLTGTQIKNGIRPVEILSTN